MSEAKLCPMLKVGMRVYYAQTRDITTPEIEPATFLPCVQEKCEWWVGESPVPYTNRYTGQEATVSVPGHCAILDIGRGR